MPFVAALNNLRLASRRLKKNIKEYPVVAQMAMSIVALHVVATIVDYYITKYAAKPMEQLQNLTTQYAVGMRRLEEKEEREKKVRKQGGVVVPPANTRMWRTNRVLLTLQLAADRAKMISSTECALFVHTEHRIQP